MSLLAVLVSIAPIFLIIVLGYLLRRNGIPNVEFWNLNDKLVYWVLMPSLLFYKTSTIEISLDLIGSYAIVILGGFAVALVFGIWAPRLAGMPNAAVSSVMQGAARHNTFIALSIAERVFGSEGLSIAALGTALLIPVTNLSIVPGMVMLNQGGRKGGVVWAVARDLGRNPLLLAVLLGVSVNLLNIGEIPIFHETVQVIGNAALPIVLMCVGANLRLRAMHASALPLILSIMGKFVIFPAVTVLLCLQLGLSELETYIAVLFAASPTASAAYTLARQLGGDAPLMAAITTIQTGLAFVTLPVTLMLVELLFP
ncbi:AEC family transporter [Rhodobacteraceae bacterium NNCM2]|nr:AEC family transporter [Coraliihabitans acroporae]